MAQYTYNELVTKVDSLGYNMLNAKAVARDIAE